MNCKACVAKDAEIERLTAERDKARTEAVRLLNENLSLRSDLAAVVEAAGNALDRLFMYDPNTSVIDELDRALDRPSVLALREAK